MQMDVGPLGSPPRMRGKGCYMQELSGETGITPAYAGKRQRRATACTWLRDHPRVCGEKHRPTWMFPAHTGSPPRMRGKVLNEEETQQEIGITPAYAGKSMYRTTETLCCRDHPRVCGEKPVAMHSCTMTRGSPPRMRGKVGDDLFLLLFAGITPACAGKSRQVDTCLLLFEDHPRVCGEKPDILPLSAWTRGSPPRMRGKVQLQPGQPAALGITPAYAGKSKNLPALVCGNGDHPRVCGEK